MIAGTLTSMRFGDVDLPAELVSAQADGRLVLFVGAGASVPAPSNLPTFRELAQRIADDSQVPYTRQISISPTNSSVGSTTETWMSTCVSGI